MHIRHFENWKITLGMKKNRSAQITSTALHHTTQNLHTTLYGQNTISIFYDGG